MVLSGDPFWAPRKPNVLRGKQISLSMGKWTVTTAGDSSEDDAGKDQRCGNAGHCDQQKQRSIDSTTANRSFSKCRS